MDGCAELLGVDLGLLFLDGFDENRHVLAVGDGVEVVFLGGRLDDLEDGGLDLLGDEAKVAPLAGDAIRAGLRIPEEADQAQGEHLLEAVLALALPRVVLPEVDESTAIGSLVVEADVAASEVGDPPREEILFRNDRAGEGAAGSRDLGQRRARGAVSFRPTAARGLAALRSP